MYRVLLQINHTRRRSKLWQRRLFFTTIAHAIEDLSKIFHRSPEWHVSNYTASVWLSVYEVGERLSDLEHVAASIRAKLKLDEKGVQLHITQEQPISPEEANAALRRFLELEDEEEE